MAASAARKTTTEAPRQRRGAHLRVVADKPKAATGRPRSGKPGSTTKAAATKAVASKSSKTAKPRTGKTAKQVRSSRASATAQRGSAVRSAAPRGAARTRPRPAAFSADGIISRATEAVFPSSCVESPIAATCRTTFRLFMVGLVLLAAFGMVRVTLSAQAAEASALSQRMKTELRTEREQAETLELYKGALMQPSRVESIAASAGMTRPGDVRYIALPKKLPAAPAATPKTTSMLPVEVRGVLEAAAAISAREAQVLLASGSALGGAR
jgi:hypothetical protein